MIRNLIFLTLLTLPNISFSQIGTTSYKCSCGETHTTNVYFAGDTYYIIPKGTPRWTWPGSIYSHLLNDHNINTKNWLDQDRIELHSYLHVQEKSRLIWK